MWFCDGWWLIVLFVFVVGVEVFDTVVVAAVARGYIITYLV